LSGERTINGASCRRAQCAALQHLWIRTLHGVVDQAATRARPFATRLGVALTVATRAAEPHFLQNFESLTELPNRRHLRERSSQEVSRASRTNSSLALLHVDLDQFKRVNDGAGHEVGDVVLKEAADRLRCHLREEDLIAHFGGDEFVLLLPAKDFEAFLRRWGDQGHPSRRTRFAARKRAPPRMPDFRPARIRMLRSRIAVGRP
jgi:GGDEF domain-containing protein